MGVSAAGGDEDEQVTLEVRMLDEGLGRGNGRETWNGRKVAGIQRSAWVIRVVVQSCEVQISGTPTLLMFDLRSQ